MDTGMMQTAGSAAVPPVRSMPNNPPRYDNSETASFTSEPQHRFSASGWGAEINTDAGLPSSLPSRNDDSVSNADILPSPSETIKAVFEVFERIRKHTLPIEFLDKEFMLLQRPKKSITQVSYVHRTLHPGKGGDPDEDAVTIRVGLTYFAGSDTTEVVRMEQMDMMYQDQKPDQMTPLWRVNTARQLLLEFKVEEDLSVVIKDSTPEVTEKALDRERAALNRERALTRNTLPAPPIQYWPQPLPPQLYTLKHGELVPIPPGPPLLQDGRLSVPPLPQPLSPQPYTLKHGELVPIPPGPPLLQDYWLPEPPLLQSVVENGVLVQHLPGLGLPLLQKNRLLEPPLRRSFPLPQPRMRQKMTANINSDRVKIIRGLCEEGEFDIDGVLIEVDYRSMMHLLLRWRILVYRTGVLSLNETIQLLDAMMEDVRRLCYRSPILLRMSTRSRIITSRNIRYGTNTSRQFQTIATSRNIQNIILDSAAFYNTLNIDKNIQSTMRPRFLQMLVILLSFLTEEDLREIREFLEQTFRFRADRTSLELLILRTLPLESINPKLFLSSLALALEGRLPDQQPTEFEEFKRQWDALMSRTMEKGFMLPGTMSMLGRPSFSWLVDWPDEGFKDSSVFAHLQCVDHYWHNFNIIPRMENIRATDRGTEELTVLLGNTKAYVIYAADYEAIMRMNPGRYLIKAVEGGAILELEICEEWINQGNYEAAKEMNDLIRKVNSLPYSQPFRHRRKHGKINDLVYVDTVTYPVRLSKTLARIGRNTIAIAYKINGRKISYSDARSIINTEKVELKSVRKYYSSYLKDNHDCFDADSMKQVREGIAKVKQLGRSTRWDDEVVITELTLDDDPITKVLTPPTDVPAGTSPWHPYDARYGPAGRLMLEAHSSLVTNVAWLLDGKTIKITLDAHPEHEYACCSLELVASTRQEEQVRAGDTAILVGNYMIIAEREDGAREGLYCNNFLKIVDISVPTESARGAKRRGLHYDSGGAAGERHGEPGQNGVSALVLL